VAATGQPSWTASDGTTRPPPDVHRLHSARSPDPRVPKTAVAPTFAPLMPRRPRNRPSEDCHGRSKRRRTPLRTRYLRPVLTQGLDTRKNRRARSGETPMHSAISDHDAPFARAPSTASCKVWQWRLTSSSADVVRTGPPWSTDRSHASDRFSRCSRGKPGTHQGMGGDAMIDNVPDRTTGGWGA
jgi:hypothetical protein